MLEKYVHGKINFDHYPDEEKNIFIFTIKHLETMEAKFCYLANKLRTFLKSPKNLS